MLKENNELCESIVDILLNCEVEYVEIMKIEYCMLLIECLSYNELVFDKTHNKQHRAYVFSGQAQKKTLRGN